MDLANMSITQYLAKVKLSFDKNKQSFDYFISDEQFSKKSSS